ncbi:MAG: M17 family peptidase N-terminal domain-containing protein [Desulfuromonadales bacterium]|nr:M17 family peptidase N-terminal domain-containing protein [Desulfuromonadales bacterium]MDW7756518.1 M17 family peptidase N-terminal domain-containing protein [Desulfuromonadales bacterium]
MTRVRVLDLPADKLDGEVIVSFIFEDQKPVRGAAALLDWRLRGLLTKKLLDGFIGGEAGQRLAVLTDHRVSADWVMFFGGGKSQSLDTKKMESLARQALETVYRAGFRRVALALILPAQERQESLQGAIESFLAGSSLVNMECLLTFQGE